MEGLLQKKQEIGMTENVMERLLDVENRKKKQERTGARECEQRYWQPYWQPCLH
jgi:hypothetical protein